MLFLGGNRGESGQKWIANRLAEGTSGLVDLAFDDWGLLIVGGVVLVVFVAVSLFGGLLSGEGFKGLK